MKQFFLILAACSLLNLLASAQDTNDSQIVNQIIQTKKHGSTEAVTVKYNTDNSPIDIREVELPESYQQLQVAGDIRIVLVNDATKKFVLSGNQKDLNLVKFILSNDELVVDASRKNSLSALTLYVPVTNMKLMTVNGDAEIYSSGAIKANDLKIILNGVSQVSMNYEGKINIVPGEGYDLVVSKNHNSK